MSLLRHTLSIVAAVTCVVVTTATPSWLLTITPAIRHSIQVDHSAPLQRSRVVRVGVHPGPIAVDSRTRRVFVVDQGRFSADYRLPIARGSVSVLDADSGRLLRTVAVGIGASAIAVSERTGRVFVVNSGVYDDNTESFPNSGTVSVLDARTGALVRSVRLSSGINTTITLDTLTDLVLDAPARRVLAINPRGLYVLDDTTGAILRVIPAVNNGDDLAVNARTGRVFLDTGEITGLDALTGRVVTHTSLDLPAYAMSVDERANRVVVSVSDARGLTSGIRVLDATTGKLLHSVNPLDYPGATMTLDAVTSRAFIVNYPDYEEDLNVGSDTLHIVDTRNGRVLASHGFSGVGNDYHLLADERRGRVFVVVQQVDRANCCTALLGRGLVEVLDARNGRIMRQVIVGKGAEGIALDSRTGRVFVANSDDGTVSSINPPATR